MSLLPREGKIIKNRCASAMAIPHGKVKEISVKIPAGVEDGQYIRMRKVMALMVARAIFSFLSAKRLMMYRA